MIDGERFDIDVAAGSGDAEVGQAVANAWNERHASGARRAEVGEGGAVVLPGMVHPHWFVFSITV